MSAYFLTWFRFYGDLQAQKFTKKKVKNVNFDQMIRIIQPGALTLCQDIFNGYLWSYTIGTDDVSMRFDLS